MEGEVSKVKTGDILFLHNVHSQTMDGPFFAVSNGMRDIVPEAWNRQFPQQVKVEKKGKVSTIHKKSFDDFGLRYSKDEKFFDFQIPIDVGRKLVEEMGLVVDLVNKEIKDFNPLDNVDVDFRLRFPAKYRCEDGHYVRSISETLIDNWLFNHKFVHGYEKKIPGEFMVCDFYLVNSKGEEIFVEFWGLDNSEEYLKRKSEKEKIYSKRKLRLINIVNKNIQNLDDYLGDKLKNFQ